MVLEDKSDADQYPQLNQNNIAEANSKQQMAIPLTQGEVGSAVNKLSISKRPGCDDITR